jgi:peroxiredoxin
VNDSWIREMKTALARLPTAAASPELLARIHERLAANEHVILPLADPPLASARWRVAAAAVLVLAASGGLWFAWPTATLTAGDIQGELTFTPATPRAGTTVQVTYRAPTTLAGRDRLVLRARYRTPRDEAYQWNTRQTIAAELKPEGGGLFRASLRLPDSVVYGAFALEDSDGRIVDSNGRRLWELLVHDREGRPTFDALKQRENDMMGRNWEEGYATARQLAALYPDRVGSWSNLFFYEKYALGQSHLDSALDGHRARLKAFHDRLARRASLTGDDLGAMFWYAMDVGDSVREAFWRSRLEREAPTSPLAVQNRALAIGARAWKDKDSVRALVDLDRLWDEAGPAHGNLVNMGWSMAQRVGDSAGLVRWADHYLVMNRRDSSWIATVFTRFPALREEGMRRLRRHLQDLQTLNGSRRALERTVDEQRTVDAASARQILVALGDALVASGRTTAGLDTLKLAVREGWDVSLFRRVAEIERSSGDTAGALRLLALVAADPATEELTGASVDSAAWARLLQEGRGEMRRRLLDMAVRRGLPPAVRLEAAGGSAAPFDSLTRDRVTFVAFWSRHCGPSLEELPALQRLTARLRKQGVAIVTITDERVSDDLQRFLADQKLTFPVYADAWREASRAFSQWGTPSYFVLDSDGVVRFEYQALDRVPVEVAALR